MRRVAAEAEAWAASRGEGSGRPLWDGRTPLLPASQRGGLRRRERRPSAVGRKDGASRYPVVRALITLCQHTGVPREQLFFRHSLNVPELTTMRLGKETFPDFSEFFDGVFPLNQGCFPLMVPQTALKHGCPDILPAVFAKNAQHDGHLPTSQTAGVNRFQPTQSSGKTSLPPSFPFLMEA